MANKKDFSYNPVGLSRERTKFALPFNHKTSFKLGELIPLACIDILPGDTFSSKVASVIRMSSPIAPIMITLILTIILSLFLLDFFGNIGKSSVELIRLVLGPILLITLSLL